jgi:hypothetical protein
LEQSSWAFKLPRDHLCQILKGSVIDGNLKVVRFLIEERNVPCIIQTIILAIEHKQTKIVSYLVTQKNLSKHRQGDKVIRHILKSCRDLLWPGSQGHAYIKLLSVIVYQGICPKLRLADNQVERALLEALIKYFYQTQRSRYLMAWTYR